MSNEKEFFNYGFITVFVITGITYLFTGNFNQTVNALCAGSLMVLFGLICLRYKTKEYIAKNKLLNLLIYALLGLCAGILLSAMFAPASALSVDVLQDGKYTKLNITGEPPFDVYTDEGDNRYTWSNIVVMELDSGRTNQLVIFDGLNDTVTATVDVPVISVDIFISIIVIVAALFSLLGIRYPLFIIPSMVLSLIWFAYLSKNPYIEETQTLVHSIIAICPFLTMAYWGINK
ncbi:MAG: hypothetical protein PHW82_16240 [Bacteroidales bacterium]|nr:hypothetical protein [Bacteroidales bacterium]